MWDDIMVIVVVAERGRYLIKAAFNCTYNFLGDMGS